MSKRAVFFLKSKSCHSAWENGCDTLTVEGLHENWTLVLGVLPLAAASSLIVEETDERRTSNVERRMKLLAASGRGMINC